MITHIQRMHPTARTPRVIRSVELSASAHGGNEIHNPSYTQYVPNRPPSRVLAGVAPVHQIALGEPAVTKPFDFRRLDRSRDELRHRPADAERC